MTQFPSFWYRQCGTYIYYWHHGRPHFKHINHPLKKFPYILALCRQCSVCDFSFNVYYIRMRDCCLRKIRQKGPIISCGQHVTFHEMIMMYRLYQTDILSWIGLLLVPYSNSSRVDHDSNILIPNPAVFFLSPWLRTYHRSNKY